MKKRLLFVFFCSILLCLSLAALASSGELDTCQHEFELVEEQIEPTCVDPGRTAGYRCSLCGATTGMQALDPRGHTIEVDEAEPVTCTSNGKTAGSHCSECGQIIEAQKTIYSTGHLTVIDEAVDSTCSEHGRTRGSHCGICNEVFVAPKVKELLPHTFTEKTYTRDCTHEGYVLHTCQVCGFYYKSDYDYAIGHQLDITPGKLQTCTESGLSVKLTCNVCNEVIEPARVIPPLGHQWTATVTPATTKKAGKRVTTCSVCGEKQGEEPIAKIALVKLSDTKFVYDKKAKKPTVTVIDETGKTLVYQTDYKLKYDSGRKKAGTYYVSVTFRGDYTGTKTLKFKIVLPDAKGLKVTAAKNQAKLSWKKTDGATKYVIYYALAKDGKYQKLATTKKLAYTVKNLTPGATYYFKIRPMTVSTTGSNTYGGYSAVKKAKIA